MKVKPIALISTADDPITKALPKVYRADHFCHVIAAIDDLVRGDLSNAPQSRSSK